MPDDTLTAAEAQARPSPDVMRGVIPYLSMEGRAGEAADFYARAFGASELGRMPDAENPARHMHVQIEINGGALMMTDMRAEGAPAHTPQGLHLQLVVADGDAWWNRAVDAGCEVVVPFEMMFWGDRWGLLRDPFGIDWAIDEPAPAA